MKIDFTVNGTIVSADVDPSTRLMDLLRDTLALTGTKNGCSEGECGACSVLVDGRSVCSCLVPAFQISGSDVVTVEGLAGEVLHPIQDAFLKHGAAQCGICTPGLLITAAELSAQEIPPPASEVRELLAGNLCRCTGYQKIIDAVVEVVCVSS
jgi:aerobic-type carbon monoxide dehydrogenase small subunit (CoxS/CutS family)